MALVRAPGEAFARKRELQSKAWHGNCVANACTLAIRQVPTGRSASNIEFPSSTKAHSRAGTTYLEGFRGSKSELGFEVHACDVARFSGGGPQFVGPTGPELPLAALIVLAKNLRISRGRAFARDCISVSCSSAGW